MWTRSFKCFLAVVFFACVFLAGSGVLAGAYVEAGASVLSNTGALQDTEDIPGVHDKHKGIRSYDSTGFPHDNNANLGVKSYGTSSGHGASSDHGIKGGDHGYNKNSDGCSKCKWENDDYWERDEPEEEGDENDGDECDDGQYRPDKAHHPGRGHKPGSHPSGVHKTGPTGVYGDDGIKRGGSPDGPSGGINYPTGIGYTTPISGYQTTPKPGSGWNTPFADASKPGYSSPGVFGTTPSSWPDWNRGTTPSGPGSSPKPWSGGHDGRFPYSQGSVPLVPNFGATSKPGQGWNNQFPSSAAHTGSGISSPSNYGNPQGDQKPYYGQPGTQNTYAGAYAGTSVTSGVGSSYGEPFNFGRKDHPFGLYKPVNTQTPYGLRGGTDQAPSNIDSGYGYKGDKPYSIRPVTNTFGTTKGPYEGIGSSRTVPGVQENPFAPGRSPGSPSGSGVYPGVTKPSYGGSTTSWLGAGQTGSGNNTWPNTRTTPHAGFPTLSTGFGTTKTPFRPVNIPSPTLSVPYDRTRPKQPGFSVASSSATASASTSAFGTSPRTYSTPSITATTSFSGTPTHRGSSYTPGVKGSVGNTRPTYETVPHGTHPNIESGLTWPGGQPASSIVPWSSGEPEDGSGITPGRYSPSVSGTLPGKQPQGGRTWSPGQPGSGTWPGQVQPGHGSRPGCSGRNCAGATGPHGTYPNIESGTWPGGQPGSNIVPWTSGKPEDGSGIIPGRYSPSVSGILPGKQPQGDGTWSPGQPGSGSGTWPGQAQPEQGSRPGCSGRNCAGATGPQEESNCGGCCGNYNCDGGCSGRGNVPATHGLCGGSPSKVNKTYYPAGTGDGNVPNIGTAYGPGLNTGAVYPGTQGTSVTSSPEPWNSANPFLYQPGGGTPSSVSRPWTETTDKPIGQGNPFLDSNWSGSRPGHSNVYDKNVIPHGEENTKPIGQGNLFLDGSNRRENVGTNPNEGKIPEGNNPFLRPLGGSSGSGSPSYGKHPDKLGTPGNFPGSGIPGNYPGSGTPGNYPGSATSGSSSGTSTQGTYSGSGALGNFPGSGTPGTYPGSRTLGSFPGASENYPRSGIPGSGGYGGVKGSFHPGGAPQQDGNSGGSHPTGSNPQGTSPVECKLGLFGCGSPGSGSYAGNKHPGGVFGGIGGSVGSGTGNPVGNVPGGPGNPNLVSGAGYPGSGGDNLAASISGGQAQTYAGSYSSAQASSSSFAGSSSGASGPANNFGGNLSPTGAQNQGGPNSWASSGASAFASSSAGSWSGNRPIDVKG